MQQEDKKKLIKEAAGKILKRLKGDKSLYILAMEYEAWAKRPATHNDF